jgi:hypothetical protein
MKMIQLSSKIRSVFASTKIKEHNADYSIISISIGEEEKARKILKDLSPWSSITFDPKEVSVVLKRNQWTYLRKNFKDYKEEGPYRLFTFDIVLDLSLVGYLSVISSVLAEEGVSIYAMSTYLRDHILVKKEDSKKVIKVLERLIESCKRY